MSATTANNIRPDFTHRIDGDLVNSLDLADMISMMAYRAKGVLQLVSVNIDADNQASDEIVKAAIDSAIAEIEDIHVTVQAFHAATAARGKA